MRILCAAHHWITKRLWQRYPKNVGYIIQPTNIGKLDLFVPYGLDNRAHSLWKNGRKFGDNGSDRQFLKMLEFYAQQHHQPEWVAVPDKVCDPETTLRQWKTWAPIVKDFNFQTAFVVQEGHKLQDVPNDADFVFIGGGSDQWRWPAVKEFCPRFPSHIGMVNGKKIWFAHCAGAISCDGSGWFRGDPNQMMILLDYLKAVNLDVENYWIMPNNKNKKDFIQLSLLEENQEGQNNLD